MTTNSWIDILLKISSSMAAEDLPVAEATILGVRQDGYLAGLDDAIKALRSKEFHDAADEVQRLKANGVV